MTKVVVVLTLLTACAPAAPEQAPPVAERAQRQVDYSVTTRPAIPQRRFFLDFVSLSDRELCISADKWPTDEGLMGGGRSPNVEADMRRVAPRGELSGYVLFGDGPVDGHTARYADFDPEPIFCESGDTL